MTQTVFLSRAQNGKPGFYAENNRILAMPLTEEVYTRCLQDDVQARALAGSFGFLFANDVATLDWIFR